jgi:hypothetical protein
MIVDLIPAVAFFALAAYFLVPDQIAPWRPRARAPRADLWMIPTLALVAGLLSFWVAEQADMWPMAVAGLAAYLLAISYVRVPRRIRQLTVAEIVFDPSEQIEDGRNRFADLELDGAPVAEAKALPSRRALRVAPEIGTDARNGFGPVSRIGQ